MPRPLLLCFTIVAGFQLQSASAAQVFEDVPVPAPIAAIARTLGLDPASNRARFVAELTRLLYTPAQGKNPTIEAALQEAARREAAGAGRDLVTVPVPLPAAVWNRAVFRRSISPAHLLTAIAADRRAALLAYGLTGMDDETLAYLAEEPAILSRLYQESAPAFAAFGGNLRIQSRRVVPPGGDLAVALWESVVGFRVSNPDGFIRALFSVGNGRLAYLYDLIAQLDRPHQAFVLGAWIADAAVRLERFQALVAVAVRAYPEWQPNEHPFSKPVSDLTFLFVRTRVVPSGVPEPPAARAFWTAVFSTDDPFAESPEWSPDERGDLMDAAWLAEATSFGDQYERTDRLAQVAFGQRAFKDIGLAERDAALAAVRALRRQQMLVLTLERMGVSTPAVYASAARHISRIAVRDPTRGFWVLSQLQGALALVARATIAGSIDPASAGELTVSLCAVPVGSDGRYAGALAEWVEGELLPRLPAGANAEERIIAALAGPSTKQTPRVVWEGQSYRIDMTAAEARRLRAVRERQQSYTVDFALALHRVARWLAADNPTTATVREAAEELTAVSEEFRDQMTRPEPNVLPKGVQPPRRAGERIESAGKDLNSIAAGRDVRRAARIGTQLSEFADTVLGEALLSLAYAAALGDPDGTALLPRNVALRHDFGLAQMDSDTRARLPWALPRQEFQPGVPWHVIGSALGLDVALAPLALRRSNIELIGEAPRLPSHEREVLSVSAVLMNSRRLDDEDRDRIADAIERGRRRVLALASGGESFDAIAEELGVEGRRRRAIRWMLDEDPANVPSMFSMVELLTLGGGAPGADLDAWGMSALVSWSCICTRLLSPREWALFAGRPQFGLMVPTMPDLNLHVALVLKEMGLPAGLTQPVVAAATQDFALRAAPADPNDWWALIRAAKATSREDIEDYVTETTAVDGPLVPEDAKSSPEP